MSATIAAETSPVKAPFLSQYRSWEATATGDPATAWCTSRSTGNGGAIITSRPVRPAQPLATAPARFGSARFTSTCVLVFRAARCGLAPVRLALFTVTTPSITRPQVPSTVTSWPFCSVFDAPSAPTTQGMPSSRLTMAAWEVRPPASVTMAAARFIAGT